MGKHAKDEFSNLRNEDGTVGTPIGPPDNTTYCDTCGSSGGPVAVSVYHPAQDAWENVPCPMHNPRAH